jgi:hypothetical protein
MLAETRLPGLDRLIAVCQRHSLPLKLSPPLSSSPKHGAHVLGEPLDPQLAAVFGHIGGAKLGPLWLYSPGADRMDFIPWNEQLREGNLEPYRSSLVFGEQTGFPLYYGTVAKLADAQGLQPVVHVNGYETYAIPIASTVDRFFNVYSRYLELMVVDLEYTHHGIAGIHFPSAVTQLIAHDEPLMELVREGRFDFLINYSRDAAIWLQELREAVS